MDQRDEIPDLSKGLIRQKIDEGMASLRRGEGIDGDEFFAALEREEEGLAEKRP